MHEEGRKRLGFDISFTENLSSLSFSDSETESEYGDEDFKDPLYHQHHYDDIAGLINQYDPVANDSRHIYDSDPDDISCSMPSFHKWRSDDEDQKPERSHSASVMQGLINDLDYILVRNYREKEVTH